MRSRIEEESREEQRRIGRGKDREKDEDLLKE